LLCSQGEQERNYHIFYQLCAGSDAGLRERLHLAAPDAFRYLARGCTQYFSSEQAATSIGADRLSASQRKYGRLKDALLDDVADFKRVDRGLASIGLDEGDRFSVYNTIAAVLHLGNIEFQVNTFCIPGH
jgi:myosin-6